MEASVVGKIVCCGARYFSRHPDLPVRRWPIGIGLIPQSGFRRIDAGLAACENSGCLSELSGPGIYDMTMQLTAVFEKVLRRLLMTDDVWNRVQAAARGA
jgi:hypothetical protein